ncbi:MAG: polysaccharide biosynthesis/export family protein [Kiritimatiellae bacterium]|nr:polysaccharide biosynthesis/export family protein [Kiritimatiellia bacterium]
MEELDEREAELRQMQKLKEFRVQALTALARWWWVAIAVMVPVSAALALVIHWKTSKDPMRCEALTNLAFYPKKSGNIREMDDAQVLRVLTRRTLLAKVAESLGLGVGGVDMLRESFEIWQDAKNRNFFAVKAYAPTEAEAILRVNAFADAAIAEYRAFRTEDLRGWRESLERRKAEISNEERKIEAEEDALSKELGIVRPVEEVSRLMRQVADKRTALVDSAVKVGEAESLVKSLKEQLNGIDTAILDEADAVKKFTDMLAEDDEQIEKLSRLYTEENPRLKNYLIERREIQARYDAFLARFGVKKGQTVNLTRLDVIATQARSAQRELEHQRTMQQAIKAEVERSQARIETLSKILPRYEGLKNRRDGLQTARQSIEDTDASVRYLEASVKTEFYQLEQAMTAAQKGDFSKKKLMVIVAGGGALGGLALFLALLLEVTFGKIRGRAELAATADVTMLGVAGKNADNLDDVFLRFNEAVGGKKVLFLAPLSGAEVPASLMDAFSLQCSLGGLKTLFLEARNAANCPEDPDAVQFATVSYRGDHGVVPVADLKRLSVGELAMLEADLKILQSDFDLIVITLATGGHARDMVFRQLMKLSSATLALVGIRSTARTEFRQVVEMGMKESRPVLALGLVRTLIALCFLPVLLGGCYFNRLTNNYEQYPDLEDVGNGVVEETRLDEAERREQEAFLLKLEQEPPEAFRINAGDQVNLVVYDHPDISGLTTVTPDGYIGIVFLGQVKVAGLTLGEAAKKIEDGLGRYIKKPAVGLTPMTISSQSVSVFGGVMKPGIYTISSEMRLADLYAKAGGSGVRRIDGQDLDVADLTHSYLFRKGYENALPIDFERAINGSAPLHNVRLKKDDRIVVGTRTEAFVTVIGHIKSPHTKLWNPNLNLMEVLTSAGWLEETYWPNVIIIRGGVADPHLYKVDVDAILAGKRPNVRLASGDIVYIPHDNISEYNVFVRKLMPTGQLFNMLASPFTTWNNFQNTNRGH